MNTNASDTTGVIARVVEAYGRRSVIEKEDGTRETATTFGKRLQVVCGDRVRAREIAGSDEIQITDVMPRTSVFERTDSRGFSELLASNLTVLVAIFATRPIADLYIVDRYLAGAAFARVRSIVLLNKADLLTDEDLDLQNSIAEYEQAGYEVVRVSSTHGDGIDALRARLAGEIALFAGQSGVGKTTLTNALIPDAGRATRTLSSSTGEGRHTTVSSAMLRLSSGGELIDSPGVRDYAPPPVPESDVQCGWPEILQRSHDCRFKNCMHLREPKCAVLAAVEAQEISARRYESYKRLLNVMRGLLPSYERRR
jgi:ribosome biogenesis GTPase